MITKERIVDILDGYDKEKLCFATVCSHTSLQIFHGARAEGIPTIGLITSAAQRKIYDAFPNAMPDEFIEVDGPSGIPYKELAEKNALLIPHGSIVEYAGRGLEDAPLPVLGNRQSLIWERDRRKMFEWMKAAGLQTPALIEPSKIDRPCVVKHPGAKGGRGYAIVHSPEEFEAKFGGKDVMVQEYLTGVRAYPHYFYSPLSKDGFRAANGHLEMLSIDRRLESNVDESYRTMMAGVPIKPSFTVVGNESVVIRESLLGDILEMGRETAEAAERLFGGIPGPFCLELIVDENLQFYCFEISARIVAGTNIYPEGSPYSCYVFGEPMSMGRRIAREVNVARDMGKLGKIVY